MRLLRLSIKNVDFTKFRVIAIMLFLSLGLALMNMANNIASSTIHILNKEYKDVDSNRIIRVSSGSGRGLEEREIKYIGEISGIEMVSPDYYLALVLQNESGYPMYKAKVQPYEENLNYEYSYLEEEKSGIILPKISVYTPGENSKLEMLAGKNVYFEIEKINELGEAKITQLPVYVCGIYETELDEHTASIFATKDVMDEIYTKMGDERKVYECTVTIQEKANIYDVAEQLEKIGLATDYKQKSYMESKNNFQVLINFIRIFEYVMLVFGFLGLLIFIRGKFLARKTEFSILKLLGYSNLFVTSSIFIELMIYLGCASFWGAVIYVVAINMIEKGNWILYIQKVSMFSKDAVSTILLNVCVMSVACFIICVIVFSRIRMITPLQMLKDNHKSGRRV